MNEKTKFRTPKYEDFESFLKRSFPNPHKKQAEFFNDMFELLTTDTDTDNVTCIPARCGIGKSTFIQALIWACMKHKPEPIGLIVVTDSIRRLEGFTQTSNHIGEEWGNFLSQMKKYVAVLKSGDVPLKEQLLNQINKPILLMSTQRYFMLDEEIRENIFYFISKGKQYSRDRVIFDEKPYFTQFIDIGVGTLNQIDTALKGLDETIRSKKWLISEFEAFSERLQAVMEEKENLYNRSLTMYWKDEFSQNLTSNDTVFFEEVQKNKNNLYDEYQDLQSLRHLMKNGGIFYSKKKVDGNIYKKGFALIKDNRSFFYLGRNKVKFFVFDATCNVDPIYDIDYTNIIKCSKYDIPLKLEITNVSIPTTQNAICRNDRKAKSIIKAITDYLESEAKGDLLIVTYNKIECRFKSLFKHIAYFGNIKGFNDYKNVDKMAHIGLNRYSNLAYFLIYCSSNPEVYKQLRSFSERESIDYFDDLFQGKDKGIIDSVMVKSLLADFEQNIFRLSIRDFSNKQPVKVWTFYSNSYGCYSALSEAIEARYKPLDAEFDYQGEPITYKSEKTLNRKPANDKAKTTPQKAIEFLQDHYSFSIEDLRAYLGTNNQGIQAVKRNQCVKQEFEKFQKVGISQYKRKG